MAEQYRVTNDYRNAWGELVFRKGEIIVRVIDTPPLYRHAGDSDDIIPRFILPTYITRLEEVVNDQR